MNVLAERCRRLEEKVARLEQMIRQRNAEIDRLDRELAQARQAEPIQAVPAFTQRLRVTASGKCMLGTSFDGGACWLEKEISFDKIEHEGRPGKEP